MTVIVDVSPGFACVVSMMSVPFGLVDDSVAELIVSGLTGSLYSGGLNRYCSSPRRRSSGDRVHAGEQLAEKRVTVSQARVDR